MPKRFNTTGTCFPQIHYMVDINDKLDQITKMIENGDYFTVNRGRQYGKTTTLSMLSKKLSSDYLVFFISFETLSEKQFASIETFTAVFTELLLDSLEVGYAEDEMHTVKKFLTEYILSPEKEVLRFQRMIHRICNASLKPVVLMIDEVDQASDFSAFIKLLSILRSMYLTRLERKTFQSVILSSVYDIKNLKLKMRNEAEHEYNSPWNIAASFDVEMALDQNGIQKMLMEYDRDHQTGMDTGLMAKYIYESTSGYPFLVSALCKLMDEKIQTCNWDKASYLKAEKMLLKEENTLFDDFRKKMTQYPELHQMLYSVLYEGKKIPFHFYNPILDIANRFGYIRNKDGEVMIANRIFESWLYDLFVSEERLTSQIYNRASAEKNEFITGSRLNMKHILERFLVHYADIYGNRDDTFHEKEGRKQFMFYLKPIINGVGNIYIEAQTRDETGTDLIIDYLGEQFVVELKIWHGNAYNTRGEKQLCEYLDYFHISTGYMLSFNFNKKKKTGIREVRIGDRKLIEAVV